MHVSQRDLLDLVALARDADLDFLEVECGDFRLTLGRNGESADHGPPRAGGEAPSDRDAAASPPPVATNDHVAPAPPVAETADLPAGCVAVSAPLAGMLYRSPEPGAPPFVEVGSRVQQGDTLALIETMKVYSAVSSPAAGVVESIAADDQQPVEHGQRLFVVRGDAQ